MTVEFSQIFADRGHYKSEANEIKKIDLLLDALKCQKEIRDGEDIVVKTD